MTASDIRIGDWVDRWLPEPVRPYARLMRLDRPIGTWLLLLPCWWGLAMASSAIPELLVPSETLYLGALFGVGALVMRGAGCTVNDLWDREYDRKVARTATRPIASGAISPKQALVFLAAQLTVGLIILLQLNWTCFWLGVGVLVLVFTYPLFKRFTHWPQAILGLTFNWGALMGWAAVTDGVHMGAMILYAAGFLWTLGYDTVYAHQDKEDDALIGIKSSALALGKRTKPFMMVVYPGTLVLIWVALGQVGLPIAPTFWPLFLLTAGHLAWQIWRVDIDRPSVCMMIFKSNRDFGLAITAAIALAA